MNEGYKKVLAGHRGIDWLEKLDSLLKSKQDDIVRVMKAYECRERWLQGELFLGAPSGMVKVNEVVLWEKEGIDRRGRKRRSQAKVDYASPGLVAEIKLLGTSHQQKVVEDGSWSLKKDFERLHDSNLRPKGDLHLLIFILVNEGETNLGKACKTFSPPPEIPATELYGFKAQDWKSGDHELGMVRIWKIEPKGHS